jgi:hypothetical protein
MRLDGERVGQDGTAKKEASANPSKEGRHQRNQSTGCHAKNRKKRRKSLNQQTTIKESKNRIKAK